MKKVVNAFDSIRDLSRNKSTPGLPCVIQKDTTRGNVDLLIDIANGRVEPTPMRWGGGISGNVAALTEILDANRPVQTPVDRPLSKVDTSATFYQGSNAHPHNLRLFAAILEEQRQKAALQMEENK